MNVFDIIGPVMIGPSSSHTAGAVRIGRVVNKLMDGQTPEKLEITLSGSFAETYRGHGTDRALLAGIMGYHSWRSQEAGALNMPLSRRTCPARTPTLPASCTPWPTAPPDRSRGPASAAAISASI